MEEKNTETMTADLLSDDTLISALEAVLFAAGYAVKYDKLAEVFSVPAETVKNACALLRERLCGHGIQLLTFTDSCQLTTKEDYIDEIRAALGVRRGGNLSRASLETLAIVAYHQPVTRSYIDEVRGVDSGYCIAALVEKGLLVSKGRLDAPGRPTLYGTTDAFLRVFGLSSLDELPSAEKFLQNEADGVNPDAAAELFGDESDT